MFGVVWVCLTHILEVYLTDGVDCDFNTIRV